MERRAILDTVKQKIDADYRSRLGQWEEEFYQDDVGFWSTSTMCAWRRSSTTT